MVEGSNLVFRVANILVLVLKKDLSLISLILRHFIGCIVGVDIGSLRNRKSAVEIMAVPNDRTLNRVVFGIAQRILSRAYTTFCASAFG